MYELKQYLKAINQSKEKLMDTEDEVWESLEPDRTCEILLPKKHPEKASLEPKLTLRTRTFRNLTLRSPNFWVNSG